MPEEVADICHRAIAKLAQDRFASAGEMAEAMQAFVLKKLRGSSEPLASGHESEWMAALLPPPARPIRRRRAWPWRAALLLLVGTAAGFGMAALLRWPGSGGEPNVEHRPADDATVEMVAHAREQLRDTLRLAGTTVPRNQLRAILDDLTAVLRQSPDNIEAPGCAAGPTAGPASTGPPWKT